MALDVAKLGFSVDSSDLRKATTDLNAMAGAANKAVPAVGGVAPAVAQAGQAAARTSGLMKQFGQDARNVSYQVQDMAVQLSMGTDFMRTMSMQLPQLLGSFGLWGAAIGAVVAVGGALAPMLMATTEKAKDMDDALRGLAAAQSAYTDASELSQTSLLQLSKEFGSGAATAREMYSVLRDITLLNLQTKFSEASAGMTSAFQTLRDWLGIYQQGVTALKAGEQEGGTFRIREATAALNQELGLTIKQATDINAAFDRLNNAKTAIEQTDAFADIARLLADAADSGARLSPELLSAAENAARLGVEGLRVEQAVTASEAAASGAAGQTYVWADAMASVAAQVNAVAAALASIGGGVISRAAMFVQRNALAAGKTVAQARVEVEKFNTAAKWDAQIMGAQSKGGIFGTITAKALEAAKAVEMGNIEMAAQNAILTQNAAAAERVSARSGGGGGGRRKRGGGGGRSGRGAAPKLTEEAKAAKEASDALAKLVQEHATLQATLGMTEVQERAYRAAMDLGSGATAAQRAEVQALVPEMARLEDAQRTIRDQAQAMQDGFRDAFTSFVTGAESARDAAAGLLDKLADMFANRAFDALAGSGIGKAFAGMFGKSAAIPSFAGGGYTWDGPRSGGLDGRGGRLAMLHPRETVVDHTRRGQAAGMTYSPTFNIGGSVTAEDLAAVRREAAAGYMQMQRSMPGRVAEINRDPLRR